MTDPKVERAMTDALAISKAAGRTAFFVGVRRRDRPDLKFEGCNEAWVCGWDEANAELTTLRNANSWGGGRGPSR